MQSPTREKDGGVWLDPNSLSLSISLFFWKDIALLCWLWLWRQSSTSFCSSSSWNTSSSYTPKTRWRRHEIANDKKKGHQILQLFGICKLYDSASIIIRYDYILWLFKLWLVNGFIKLSKGYLIFLPGISFLKKEQET